MTIRTERLELVPATADLTRSALEGSEALASALGAVVPESWPPEYVDAAAFNYILARLDEGPEHHGWWLYFVVLPGGSQARTLIGTAGYKGPPNPAGEVEVGYGIVRDRRRRGYASEAVHSLIGRAFALPGVREVLAETLPELTPSIGVLKKAGFRFLGEGSEPGVIRFGLSREDYQARGALAS